MVKQVIEIVRHAYRAEGEFLHRLSESERSSEGTFTNWSPKDVLAHNMYWRRRAIQVMAYLARGQEPPAYPEYEMVNRQNFSEFVHVSLPTIKKQAEDTMIAFVDALGQFKERDLSDPSRNLAHPGMPFLSYILNNGYIHPLGHLCEAYRGLGASPSATRLVEMAAQDLEKVGTTPLIQGVGHYDLACLYATVALPDPALAELEKALELFPAGSQLAREDPDLASLSENPRFIQLTASE